MSDVNPNQHGHGMFNSVGNNGEEGVYCIRNGNELSHATRIHMGLPPNSIVYYFDDVNPNNATHLPMRVVANPGSAAKPLFGNQDHVVNPNYATHHCMGVVANPGSAAKPLFGIHDQSDLTNATHLPMRVVANHGSAAKQLSCYVSDVNPANANHPSMGVVANLGSAAKTMHGNPDGSKVENCVTDVNPANATHHCMGVVANPGSAAKTMQGIPVESQSLPNSTHGNMNSNTNDSFTIHRDHAYYSGLFSGVQLGYCNSMATSENSKYFVSLPFFHKSSTHSLRIVTISLSSTR